MDSFSTDGELSSHIEVDFKESAACYIGGLRSKKDVLLAISFYDTGVARLVIDDGEKLLPQEPVKFHQKSEVIKDRQG